MPKSLKDIRGSCLCGEITFQLKGSARVFHLCHCSRCRKSTGSAHASNIFTEPENIEWLTGMELIKRYQIPEAKSFSKQFCSNCGSLVPYVNRAGSSLIIPAGCLHTAISFVPDDNIFWDSRAEWYEQGSRTAKYPAYPED